MRTDHVSLNFGAENAHNSDEFQLVFPLMTLLNTFLCHFKSFFGRILCQKSVFYDFSASENSCVISRLFYVLNHTKMGVFSGWNQVQCNTRNNLMLYDVFDVIYMMFCDMCDVIYDPFFLSFFQIERHDVVVSLNKDNEASSLLRDDDDVIRSTTNLNLREHLALEKKIIWYDIIKHIISIIKNII